MNVPKGKASVSPPVQITQTQARNIAGPPRGQTPPTRGDFNNIVDSQANYIQQGFAVPASLPHDMNKQAVASGHIPQQGIPQQPGIFTPGIRPPQPYYTQSQQAPNMRSTRPYMASPSQANQQPMYPMMYMNQTSNFPSTGLMYQPQQQVLGYTPQGQRMTNPQYAISPHNVQQQFQQFQPSQQYAPNNTQQYLYFQQQQQQQSQPIPVAQPRPPIPTQTVPAKRERNPITIVDPNTQKDVTDEILHHKSTPPSGSGTPVSFPVMTQASPSPPQQNEICAQFASQVAATLRHNSTKQQSSTPPSVMDASSPPTGTIIPADEQQEIFEPCVDDVGTIIPGETSVDPPPINTDKVPIQSDMKEPAVQFDTNEYNVNIAPPAPKIVPVPKTVSVSAAELYTNKELPSGEPEPVPKVSGSPKTASVSAVLTPDVSEFKPASFTANKGNQNTQKASISVGSSQKQSVSVSVSPTKDTVTQPTSVPEVKSQKPVTVTASAPVQPSPVITASPVSTENKDLKSTPTNLKSTPTNLKSTPTNVSATEESVKVPASVKTPASVKAAPLPVKSVPSPAPVVPTVAEKEVEKSKPVDLKPKIEKTEEKTDKIKNGSVSKEVTQERPDTTTQTTTATKQDPESSEEVQKPTETKPKDAEEPVKPVKEPVASVPIPKPVPVTPDNKDEKIPQVEIKIEDVDVCKENAKNNEMTTEALNSEPKKPKMQLQYNYKADQWSPLNQEGKMIYDRDFLLQLQFSNNSVSKPQGLPNLPDIILDKPTLMSSAKRNDMGNTVPDFTPDFFQTMSGRSGSSQMIKKRNSQQGPRNDGPKKIIKTVSISQDIKLHKAENAWEPGRKVETAKNEEVDETEARTQEIYKRVKSILNKLTPQKFQTLLKQVQDLNIDTETRLKGVTDLIFEKAVSEPAFSVAYANMCRYLMQLKVPSDSKPGEKVNFRVILLTKCQREFEKDKDVEIDLEARQKKIDEADSEDVKKQLQEEMEIAATTARRRSIGNIRFIGELFKLKMLTENIMHDCVFKLLRSRDEENLECLCRLLTTIGKELDTEKAKPRVDQYFQKMQKIVGEKKTSSRVRFMLQDVIDLRLCNWVPRREDNNPKTIDQIHKEAAKENAQKNFLLSQNPPQSSNKQSRDGGRPRGSGPPNRGGPQQNNQRNDDGWNTVASKPLRNIDLSKMKITKTTVDENIQLGPGGGSSRFGVWGRGSSGGGHTKSSSQEGESPANAPANRFTGLRTEEEGGRPFGRGISPARSDSRNRGQGGGFGRGRLTPRSSMEGERDRAIANVRNLTGRTSNPASRESSRSREPRMDKPEAAPVPGILSEDEMEKKTKTIIDEYLHINDVKEALMCVSEISNPATVHLFIEFSINHVLERSSIARQQTGNLHHELVSKKIISVDSYLKGLNQTLQIAEDMEIDIPKIWQYLGELIGPMIQDGSVPLNFLKQACEPLQASGKSGVVVAAVLHDASQRLGHKKVATLWKSSGLQWTDFVAAENVTEFLADKKLEFTVAADSQPSTPVDKVSFETIQEQLLVRLRDVNFDNEHMFDWIEANIPDESTKNPKFIRTLMTAVCKSAVSEGPNYKVNENVIKQRQSLLVKYLDSQQEFEIQALYALQAFVNELQHPGGVLRTFFETLYDEDIISEDAFNQWSNSNDPAEQEGKGVAMKQVVQFFAWLKEGEQDES
ncbi:hypothetical protein SNE40_013400 [Patella caerulea]|uniref:Uncharacterized protein n=1 Tax=Patella caerulea TaxID=87958 RepID=A0AAN8JFY9_PATCE